MGNFLWTLLSYVSLLVAGWPLLVQRDGNFHWSLIKNVWLQDFMLSFHASSVLQKTETSFGLLVSPSGVQPGFVGKTYTGAQFAAPIAMRRFRIYPGNMISEIHQDRWRRWAEDSYSYVDGPQYATAAISLRLRIKRKGWNRQSLYDTYDANPLNHQPSMHLVLQKGKHLITNIEPQGILFCRRGNSFIINTEAVQ